MFQVYLLVCYCSLFPTVSRVMSIEHPAKLNSLTSGYNINNSTLVCGPNCAETYVLSATEPLCCSNPKIAKKDTEKEPFQCDFVEETRANKPPRRPYRTASSLQRSFNLLDVFALHLHSYSHEISCSVKSVFCVCACVSYFS